MKKTWSIIIATTIIISVSASVWGVASYWFGYCATETIHETTQSENIQLAMNQSSLAIYQQRAYFLEQRIYEMETKYLCPACEGTIKKIYTKYVLEYNALLKKIESLSK